MPRVPLDPKHKQQNATDFPRLKFDKDERARIVCIETDPLFEFIHTLRAPAVAEGKAVMEMQTARDGTQVSRMKYDFIGRPICLGDVGIVLEKGSDPEHCPMCKIASTSDTVPLPERRFAMHVIKYGTQPGSFDIANPFQASCVVWSFPDAVYNKLVDLKSEWGDLRAHDLNLGPCTNVQFQKFEISISATAAWLANDQTKQFVATVYKENQATDLSVFCGRRSDRSFLVQDLARIAERNKVVFGDGSMSLDPEIADVLSQQTGMDVGASGIDFSDLLGGGVAPTTPGPLPVDPPVPEVPEAPSIPPSELSTPAPEAGGTIADLSPDAALVTESSPTVPPALTRERTIEELLGESTAVQEPAPPPEPAAAPTPEPPAQEASPPATPPVSGTVSFDDLLNSV